MPQPVAEEVARAYGECVGQLRELHGGPGVCVSVCVSECVSECCLGARPHPCLFSQRTTWSGLPLPKLVDVEWRLDFVARSSSADLAHQPQYLVKLTTACSGVTPCTRDLWMEGGLTVYVPQGTSTTEAVQHCVLPQGVLHGT